MRQFQCSCRPQDTWSPDIGPLLLLSCYLFYQNPLGKLKSPHRCAKDQSPFLPVHTSLAQSKYGQQSHPIGNIPVGHVV